MEEKFDDVDNNNTSSTKRRGIFLSFMIIFAVITVILKVFSVITLLPNHSNLIIPNCFPFINLFSTGLLIILVHLLLMFYLLKNVPLSLL